MHSILKNAFYSKEFILYYRIHSTLENSFYTYRNLSLCVDFILQADKTNNWMNFFLYRNNHL